MTVSQPEYQAGRRLIVSALKPILNKNWLVAKFEPELPSPPGKVVDGAYFYEVADGIVLRAVLHWGNKSYDDTVRAISVTRPCSALSVFGDNSDTGTIQARLLNSFTLERI